MYTYNSLNSCFNEGKLMNTAGKILLSDQRDILHRPVGITIFKSTNFLWFSRWSVGEGWSSLSEARSLKPTQRGSSGSSPLRFDGSRDGQPWGWTSYVVAAQGLYSLELKPRGTIRLDPLRSDGYLDCQTGGWTSCLGGQRCWNKS